MVALNPRLSGKLDRIIEIARPHVADPDGDGVTYSVRRSGDLVTSWQAYGHEVIGNTIRLRLDLGLNQDFEAATGSFPTGTQIFYTTEDGAEDRYTITGFVPTEDPFDYAPAIAILGNSAEFHYSDDLQFAPGLNQKATGSAFVVAELDRAFDWPTGNVRSIYVDVGYSTTPARDLFAEDTRKAWARLENNRVSETGRELEWSVGDPDIAVGDMIVYEGLRLAVSEVQGIDRSDVRQVTAVLEADGTA